MSILGTIVFPIFIFFIIEGFFKKHDRAKYLRNLLVFMVILEVPFDIFTSKELFDPYWNNMMFTLALCLVTVRIIDFIKDRFNNKILWYGVSVIIVAVFGFLAMYLSLDYDYHAIILFYLFYIFYDKPVISSGLGYLSIIKEEYSFLEFAFTVTYNGERGKQNKLVNYLFYPVHILILGLIRMYFSF